MSEPVQIDVTYEGREEKIYAEKISDNIYKCLESSLFADTIKYGCEIEVQEIDEKLKFIKLHKKSPFATFCYIGSKEIIESKKCERMRDEIIRIGGYWEGMMSGLLMIHLPIEKRREIDRLVGMMKDE